MASADQETIRREFGEAVNMSAGELEKWLGTEDSRVRRGEGRWLGVDRPRVREAHRRTARTEQEDLADDDYAHMRTVHGYVKRHLAQEPAKEDVGTSRWRYSLMNWGHDPLKKT